MQRGKPQKLRENKQDRKNRKLYLQSPIFSLRLLAFRIHEKISVGGKNASWEHRFEESAFLLGFRKIGNIKFGKDEAKTEDSDLHVLFKHGNPRASTPA